MQPAEHTPNASKQASNARPAPRAAGQTHEERKQATQATQATQAPAPRAAGQTHAETHARAGHFITGRK
eukprot:15478779-Heterocapsa_arctica.AAC.1